MIVKDLLPTSKKIKCISNGKTNFVMLLRNNIVHVFQKHTKHINTLRRQNANNLALKC